MKTLAELLVPGETVQTRGELGVPVSGVFHDSRRLRPGGLFVAIQGFKRAGSEYLPAAIAAGCAAVVSTRPPDARFPHLAWVQVKNDRRALSSLACRFYGNPSERLKVLGVTGTNGKTTTVLLAHAIFSQVARSAWIGTMGMGAADLQRPASLTTPEAPDLFAFMSEFADAGGRYLAMEASSAALSLFRVEDVLFRQGVFTSFSGEHLDFHGTMENYLEAKLSLFRRLASTAWAVINADDPAAGRVRNELNCKYLTFGFSGQADVRPLQSDMSLDGIRARLATPRGILEIESPLIGRFNLQNVMAAASMALAEGVEPAAIAAGVASCRPVRGRAELIHRGDFSVFVDFGHTDDALRHLLAGLREVAGKGRLIVVFGAGGDKDRFKRPRMGAVAASLADLAVVTSDNPRSEDPQAIIDEIMAGVPKGAANVQCRVDREEAVALALSLARPGDVVAIAGKGHEEVQIIGDRRIPYRDEEVVLRLLGRKDA